MQLRRPTRFVLGVGMSDCCVFRRILWTARKLHEASEAISLFSNPSFSKDFIKICCAAFSCGAMIADTKVLTRARLGKEEGNDRSVVEWWGEPPILLSLAAVPWRTTGEGCTATSVRKWTRLKELTKKLATRNSPFTVL
jgi:hypothetical protein